MPGFETSAPSRYCLCRRGGRDAHPTKQQNSCGVGRKARHRFQFEGAFAKGLFNVLKPAHHPGFVCVGAILIVRLFVRPKPETGFLAAIA